MKIKNKWNKKSRDKIEKKEKKNKSRKVLKNNNQMNGYHIWYKNQIKLNENKIKNKKSKQRKTYIKKEGPQLK